MSEHISVREAARRLGVSDTAVHKAIKAGRVTVAARTPGSDRPLLAWPACRDQWLANSDASKRSHVGGSGKSPRRAEYDTAPAEVALPLSSSGAGPASAPAAALAPPPELADDGGDGGRSFGKAAGGPSYAASRAVREAYAARLAKLEYEERSGKLVDRDVIRVEAFKVHRRIRDIILNIPDRCAPMVATMADPVEVHAYLLAEITAALRQLAADIYRPGGGA